PVPGAGGLPVAQAVPAGHAATAAHLLGQVLPGDAGLEDEDDPGEDLTIVEERAPALGLRGMRWEQRLDQSPELVREEWLGHDVSLSSRANGVSNSFGHSLQIAGHPRVVLGVLSLPPCPCQIGSLRHEVTGTEGCEAITRRSTRDLLVSLA